VTGVYQSGSGLDSAGPPWQRLLGYFASGTEGKTLAHGPAISALDWGGGARTRGETGARFEMSLCSTGCDLARGWDGGGALEEIGSASRTASREQLRVFGAVLSCPVLFSKTVGEVVASDTVHAIRGDRARPISAIFGHYSGAPRANIGSRMPILGVRVTGHWRLITGHCYSYRDDNTKYTHLTVCCTAALLRFQLPASLLENSVAHTTPYGPRATAFQK
jgi:hypothetical protein